MSEIDELFKKVKRLSLDIDSEEYKIEKEIDELFKKVKRLSLEIDSEACKIEDQQAEILRLKKLISEAEYRIFIAKSNKGSYERSLLHLLKPKAPIVLRPVVVVTGNREELEKCSRRRLKHMAEGCGMPAADADKMISPVLIEFVAAFLEMPNKVIKPATSAPVMTEDKVIDELLVALSDKPMVFNEICAKIKIGKDRARSTLQYLLVNEKIEAHKGVGGYRYYYVKKAVPVTVAPVEKRIPLGPLVKVDYAEMLDIVAPPKEEDVQEVLEIIPVQNALAEVLETGPMRDALAAPWRRNEA